tara:strand:- start:767 stop:925 length:159 start_codon:yes stop_codon:yes gene_type:complete
MWKREEVQEMLHLNSNRRAPSSNKSLQVTFDPPPIFAVAKTGVASNALDLRR